MADRRSDIDGLRAVAVLSVLFFHAGASAFSGGYVGVDVFFVISGYLITGIILEDCRRERFSFLRFYGRRIRRIFPALVLVLISVLIAGWFFLLPADYAALAKQALAGTFFVPNFLFWSEAGYFDKAAELKPLLHLWSLGIEEQFYLAWPLAIYFAASRKRTLIPFLIGVTAASFVFCVYMTAHDQVFAFYLPVTRVWELSLGGILATVHWAPTSERMRSLISAGGLVAIGASVLTFTQKDPFPGALAAIPTLGAAAVIWAGKENRISKFSLSLKPMAYIGLMSYPLYLWHWPIISFSHILKWSIPVPTILVLSVVLAVATYEIGEKRLQRLNPKFVSPPLIAGMTLAAIASFLVFKDDGLYWRYPTNVAELLKSSTYDYGPDARLYKCWLTEKNEPQDFPAECTNPKGDNGILIVGDSHAARLYPGLKMVFSRNPVWQITMSSCLPFGSRDECNRTRDYALKITREQHPRFVIIFSAWAIYSREWASESPLGKALGSIIDQYAGTGAEVVLLGPAPTWSPSLPAVAFHETQRLGHAIERCRAGVDISAIDQQLGFIASHHKATYVSVNGLLCENDECLIHPPNHPHEVMSWDYGHLTTAGAEYVSAFLKSKILRKNQTSSALFR